MPHCIPAWLKSVDGFTNNEKGRKFGDGVSSVSTSLATVKVRCLWSIQMGMFNYSLIHGTRLQKRDLSRTAMGD